MYTKIENYCLRSAEKLSQNRFFKPLPQKLGVPPENVTFAFAETVLLYNLGFVVWLPLNCGIARWYYEHRRVHGPLTRMITKRHAIETKEEKAERYREYHLEFGSEKPTRPSRGALATSPQSLPQLRRQWLCLWGSNVWGRHANSVRCRVPDPP
jgi:hypothetical protein